MKTEMNTKKNIIFLVTPAHKKAQLKTWYNAHP